MTTERRSKTNSRKSHRGKSAMVATKKNAKRKILMPIGAGRIPEEAIRRAIAEVKADRERKQRASRSKDQR